MAPQTLWLPEDATTYESFCLACAADLAERRVFSLATGSAVVQGELADGAAVGLATCGRGHRIVVRRHRSARLARVS